MKIIFVIYSVIKFFINSSYIMYDLNIELKFIYINKLYIYMYCTSNR